MSRWGRLVYFARNVDRSGPIKIGCSSSPFYRLKQLGFDHAAKFETLAEATGNFDTERWLHQRFAHCRTSAPIREDRSTPIVGATEWFEATPELLQFIDDLNAGGIELPQVDARNEAIAKRYTAGETLEAIGSSLGITRERVRQILEAKGIERRSHSQAAALYFARRRSAWAAQWAARKAAA